MGSLAGTPVELWFQDEARIEQKGTHSTIWAPVGARPLMVRDNRHDSAWLFGAICPHRAVGAATERQHLPVGSAAGGLIAAGAFDYLRAGALSPAQPMDILGKRGSCQQVSIASAARLPSPSRPMTWM